MPKSGYGSPKNLVIDDDICVIATFNEKKVTEDLAISDRRFLF